MALTRSGTAINWSAFRSRLLLGIGIAAALAAGAFYMQGCKATPEQNAANVATREAVNTANEQVQADPKATPGMKEAAKKAADAVNAGVTDTGEVDWVQGVTTVGGFLPPPWNLIVGIGGTLLATQIAARRKKPAPGATP